MEQLQNTWNIMHKHFIVLYDVYVVFVGLNNNTEHRTRLTNTRSTENDRIGADTDPEYP